MKKTFALVALLAVTMTAFTGCGGMSQDELDSNAKTLYDAAATTLVELDMQGCILLNGIPNGNVSIVDSKGEMNPNLLQEMEPYIEKYWNNSEDVELEWVVAIENNGSLCIKYACVAESYESEKIGTDGNAPAGKTLNDIIGK